MNQTSEVGGMELPERYLRLVVSLASTSSVTAAAAELGLSQPAVSQQLARLERSWGVTLFDRHARGVVPTALGRRVAQAAADTLAQLATLRGVLDAGRRAQGEAFRVDYMAYGAGELMNEIVRDFRHQTPGCRVEVSNSGFDDALDALLSGRVDVQFTFGPVRSEAIETLLLYHDPVQVAVSESSVWASCTVVDIDDLLEEPILVDHRADPEWRDFWSINHARRGEPPRIGGIYSTVEAHLNAVALGEGVTLVSRTTAVLYPREGVRYVPVTGLAPLPHWLAWRSDSCSPHLHPFLAVTKHRLRTRFPSGLRQP